jgi:hypothetical protein
MINESDKLGLESFGIRPLGEKQFRIYRCFECGHVAVFLGFWA